MPSLCLVVLLGVIGFGSADPHKKPELHGQACLDNFTKGKSNFVLELNESVSSGATFLSSPSLDRDRDCLEACCRTPGCNLALVEVVHGQDNLVNSCFLLNCLYKQDFVCKFVRKEGYLSYVRLDVSDKYLHRREDKEGENEPPVAKVSRDVKTQPNKDVTLSGIESWDKEGISSYEWHLLDGDTSVVMEPVEDQPAFLHVSNLLHGQYIFQLVVTDTVEQQSSATVTITVLTKEQTEDYCLAPKKPGKCRAAFSRWWYNPDVHECETFTFGGCNANKNNYLRKEDCTQTCVNLPDTTAKGRRLEPVCTEPCRPQQFRCGDGCCIEAGLECDDTPDCADHSDEASCDKYSSGFKKLQDLEVPDSKWRCVDLPATGPCRASFSRWYYDPIAMKCNGFTYGGCNGNGNNFLHEEECENICRGVSESDIFETKSVDPSAQEGGGSAAEVAIAVFLGICILVVLAVIGYCYLKKKKSSRRRQPVVASNAVSTTEDTEHLVYNRTTKPV
ncbi:kunitz-type protease inhibitor 1 isoform X2 [Hyperolius riggenbachi]|uniref:kunitz-type protease inhibitor 1 isoform X2 n=1 Tax=Hyperolius riggenbachi TaxID=752182 RepID=UPI0035A2FFCB